ncbi:MAG: hypothetical protein KDD62_14730, partial [Bdellovibrionales bacterium]|nr:hypothetical protein [Bdellovibrionales bacterium]
MFTQFFKRPVEVVGFAFNLSFLALFCVLSLIAGVLLLIPLVTYITIIYALLLVRSYLWDPLWRFMKKFATATKAQLQLIWGWLLVSYWLYSRLWRLCPIALTGLTIFVIVNSVAVIGTGYVLEWTINQVDMKSSYPPWMLALPVSFVVLLVWVSQKLTKTLSSTCDWHLQEDFGTYFAKFVVQWGMRCFDGGTTYFKMLDRAKSAEYSLGFYVPQQFQLLNSIARWAMGIVVVLFYLPHLWAILLFACSAVLYFQVRTAVKFTQEDLRVWGLKA